MALRESAHHDMTGAETFAEEVARRASVALSKQDVRSETYAIGNVPFRLFAPSRSEWLGRAFLAQTQWQNSSPSDFHHLVAWDATDRDALPPDRPWGPNGHVPLGVVTSHSNEAVRCAYDVHVNSLIVYNLIRNVSHTCFPNIADLPAWAKASPFRIVLSWLCNRHGIQIVHGAAVAIGGRAVLLAGAGGAGKSTTALACALAGMEYLGDDYCAVEPAGGKVHMVYRTAKVFKSTVDRVPALEDWIDNRDRLSEEKGVIFLEPENAKLVRSAELTAILLPRVGDGASPRFRPATRGEAIKAILPSTVGGLMGGTSVTPRLIMELVQNLPAFHLELGSDLRSVTDSVALRLAA